MLDSVLSFETQVHKVVKSCYATIKDISSIKKFLSESHLKQLVCSCIFSLLDYCNALYYGINSSLLTKLQRIQNCCAKLITKKKISGLSLSKAFDDLHWLRVKTRVVYKIMLIVHNCLKGQAPNELMALLQYGDSSRTLHLQMTRVKTKYGDRAFSYKAPKV